MKSYIAYAFHYSFLNYEIKNYKNGYSFNIAVKKRRDIYDWVIHGRN